MKFPFVSRATAERQANIAFKKGYDAHKEHLLTKEIEVSGCILIDPEGKPLMVKMFTSARVIQPGDELNLKIAI